MHVSFETLYCSSAAVVRHEAAVSGSNGISARRPAAAQLVLLILALIILLAAVNINICLLHQHLY